MNERYLFSRRLPQIIDVQRCAMLGQGGGTRPIR